MTTPTTAETHALSTSAVDPYTFRTSRRDVLALLEEAVLSGSTLNAHHAAWEATVRLAGHERPAPLAEYRRAWEAEKPIRDLLDDDSEERAHAEAVEAAWVAGDLEAWREAALALAAARFERAALLTDAKHRMGLAHSRQAPGFGGGSPVAPQVPQLDTFLTRVVGQACVAARRGDASASAEPVVGRLAYDERQVMAFDAQTKSALVGERFVSATTRLARAALADL